MSFGGSDPPFLLVLFSYGYYSIYLYSIPDWARCS